MDSAYSLQVCSVAFDPSVPGVVYAGTGDEQSPRPAQGVARSADGGQSWNVGVRFTNRPVCTLAVDPTNGSRLWASSAEGLFLSADAGATWRKVLAHPVTSVAFNGQGGMFLGMLGPDPLGSRDNILARSSDGGQTWTNLSLPVPASAAGAATTWVSVLARGNTVYALVSHQVPSSSQRPLDFYRSTDGGSTWFLAPAIGQGRPPVTLFADAGANNLYVAGNQLLTSRNQGDFWSSLVTTKDQFHTGVFLNRYLWILGGNYLGVIQGRFLLLAGEKGLELLAVEPELAPRFFHLPIGQFLDVTSDSSGSLWAAGPGGLLGVTQPTAGCFLGPGVDCWKARVDGVAIGNVAAAATVSPNILAEGNARVYQSSDGGATFSFRAVLPSNESRAPLPPLAMDPVNAEIAYVAGQRVYRSSNGGIEGGGVEWTPLPVVDPDPSHVVIALAIAPASRQVLYAATACLPELSLSFSCPNVSFLWRSQNSGQSWAQRATVPGLVSRLAVDPRQANTVYAAIGAFVGGSSASTGYAPGDLLRSTDGATTFASVRANLPPAPVNALVIDPASTPTFNLPAQTLYAGTDAGVFVTFNGGSQWTAINSNLPPAPVTALALRRPGATLLAATFGRGVYQTSVTGLSAGVIANPLAVNLALPLGGTATSALSLNNVSGLAMDWTLVPLDAWLSVPAPAGRLEGRRGAEVSFQVSVGGLQVGTYLGRLRLTTGLLEQIIRVTSRVTATPAQMTIAGGNNATGAVGTTVPPLVVAILDADQAPLPGVPVNFAITSGGGLLSTRSSLTDANGRASAVLTLPSTPGTVQVVASVGAVAVTFAATAIQVTRPVLLAGSVVNGASFAGGSALAPGSMVAIFGQNLAESSALAATLPLPTVLLTTRVLLATPAGEVALPLFFVSPQQINALLPLDLTLGSYSLSVESASVRGNAVEISVAAAAPGIFALSSNGRGQGIFVKPDGSLVTVTNPAARGSVVLLYATGLGDVYPPVATGEPGASDEPLNRTLQTPRVFFDVFEAEVLYSGLAPGFAGLYQVNVRVPARLSPATNIPVTLSIGGAASNRLTIPVQ